MSHAWFESSQTGYEFDGHQTTVGLARLDQLFTPGVALGLGIGYEHLDFDTAINAGETRSDGVSVTPHVSFTPFGEDTTLTLGGNLAYFWNDASRSDGTIRGDYGSTRLTGVASLRHRKTVPVAFNKQWFVDGGIDYTQLWFHSHGYQEAGGVYVASQDVQSGTLTAGGRVGYSHYDPVKDRTVTLFGLARYNWDVTGSGGTLPPSAATVDRDGMQLGGGVHAKFGPQWFASVQGTATVLSRDYEVYSLAGSLGMQF